LLPAIGGMVLGGLPAFLVAGRIGARLTVAAGFAITAAGLLLGATTSIDSSTWFVAGWIAVAGFGTGVGFITAAGAALKTVPTEKSGVASALVQAVQKVAAPLGAAIFGSVLVTFYQSNLSLGALPARVASAVKLSVFAGDAVANKFHSPALLASVHEAFLHGMDAALLVSAISVALAMVLALAFLPGRTSAEEPVREPVGVEVGHAA